jgi:hypothetical protein
MRRILWPVKEQRNGFLVTPADLMRIEKTDARNELRPIVKQSVPVHF